MTLVAKDKYGHYTLRVGHNCVAETDLLSWWARGKTASGSRVVALFKHHHEALDAFGREVFVTTPRGEVARLSRY